MNLAKEIHNFRENQKTTIPADMFILWEYKLTKTDYSKKSLFNILKFDNVHLKFEKLDKTSIQNISELKEKEFYSLLSLYKHNNKKLFKFCSQIIKDF